MDVSIEVEQDTLNAFSRNIDKLVALTGKPVQEILKQQGRLFAVSAAKYTQRYGDTAAVGKRHKKDVENSIRRIYKPARAATPLIMKRWGKKAGVKFQNYIRRRDTAKAQEMIDKANIGFFYKRDLKVIQWDGGGAHTRWIKKRGKAPVHLVFEVQKLNQFIRDKKLQVGAAKHGWAKAAKMLGHKGSGRGMPAWFASGSKQFGKGHKTRGFGRVTGRNYNAELTVAHYGKYGFSRTTMNGVWRSRTKIMIKDINRKMQAVHKKRFK